MASFAIVPPHHSYISSRNHRKILVPWFADYKDLLSITTESNSKTELSIFEPLACAGYYLRHILLLKPFLTLPAHIDC